MNVGTEAMYDHLENVVNKTWNFSGRLQTQKDHVLNAVMGLAGEAGEVLDLHKKLYFHTPKERSEELKLELGDVAYYFLKIIDLYGFSLEEILAINREKLGKRYPGYIAGY